MGHQKTTFSHELVYGAILLFSFLLGFVLSSKYVKAGNTRKFLSCFFGIFLVVVTSGWQFLHSFTCFMIAYVLMKSIRKSGWYVFWSTLVYLLFFRVCNDFLPSHFNKIIPYANAVQLLTTLRIISFGFEYENLNFTSFLDFLAYNYSYIGLFSGPFYRKTVFDDYCNNENLDKIEVKQFIIDKLKPFPVTLIVYLTLKDYMPVDYFRSQQFYEKPILQNLVSLQVIFAWCRYRFYSAWMLAEATCMSARLGAYRIERQARPGLGPKLPEKEPNSENSEIKYDFKAVYNLDKLICEFHPSIRQVMRDWNSSVQFWLATYTYKKIPNAPTYVRMIFTMTISAYWHGIAPGYFMGFLCVPLLTSTEDMLTKAFKNSEPRLWSFFLYLVKMISFSLTGIAFMLIDFDSVIKCWKASGYMIFPLCFTLIIISYIKIRWDRTVGKTRIEGKQD